MKWLRLVIVSIYTAVAAMPLLWLGLTSLKPRADSISTTAKFLPSMTAGVEGDTRFQPTFDDTFIVKEPNILIDNGNAQTLLIITCMHDDRFRKSISAITKFFARCLY